jgi:hypothetical protein
MLSPLRKAFAAQALISSRRCGVNGSAASMLPGW